MIEDCECGKEGEAMKKVASAQVDVIARLEEAVRTVQNGSVMAIVQDGRVIQYEKIEKVRLDLPMKQCGDLEKAAIEQRKNKIAEALESLLYGQVVFVVKDGKMVQIDRTEKQRFKSLQNMFGDGI